MYLKPMATFEFAREIKKGRLPGGDMSLQKNHSGGKHEEAKRYADKCR